MVDTNKQK